MLDLSTLRARWDALPLDRAPLRRAGLLSVLLVALLVVGKAFGPDRAGASAAVASRNQAPPPSERVSAPARGWTGGRVLAVVLLVAGAGGAFAIRRRSASSPGVSSAIEVLETHALGAGQTLKLIACGGEVLLVSATEQSVQLLRQWPREQFDPAHVSFADVLASVEPSAEQAPQLEAADPVAPVSPEAPAQPEAHTLEEEGAPSTDHRAEVEAIEEPAPTPATLPRLPAPLAAPRRVSEHAAPWPPRARRTLRQFEAADA